MNGYDDIKKLIEDLGKADFEELNVELPDGVKINMKKGSNNTSKNLAKDYTEVVDVTAVNDNKENLVLDKNISNENLKVITSPMVGTFYASPAPNAKPYISVGDKVKKGQVVCVIEAMKLMNEIESEYDGEIAEVCVSNEGIVEYGQPLFKIK